MVILLCNVTESKPIQRYAFCPIDHNSYDFTFEKVNRLMSYLEKHSDPLISIKMFVSCINALSSARLYAFALNKLTSHSPPSHPRWTGRCKPLPSSLFTFKPQSKQCLHPTCSQTHNNTKTRHNSSVSCKRSS